MSLDKELAKLHAVIGGVSIPFSSKSMEEKGDGTLVLRGTLATTGLDRQNEEFDGPSLRAAFKEYFARCPVVVDEHRLSKVLGWLTSYTFTDSGDIEVEAEIPKPPEGELLSTYQRIKAGILRAFSIGGKWKRLPTAGGASKLFPVEILESSIAGIGVNADALFEVVAVKALADLGGELERLDELTAAPSPLDEQLSTLKGVLL